MKDFEKSLEAEIIKEAAKNGACFRWNKNDGFYLAPEIVINLVKAVIRSALSVGIFPEEEKSRSLVFAEIEEEKERQRQEALDAEQKRLEAELAELDAQD